MKHITKYYNQEMLIGKKNVLARHTSAMYVLMHSESQSSHIKINVSPPLTNDTKEQEQHESILCQHVELRRGPTPINAAQLHRFDPAR